MATLLIAEHDNESLNEVTAKCLSAACSLEGGKVDILVAGENCGAVAQAAATLDGAGKVRVADDALYSKRLGEPMCELVLSMASEYDAIVSAATTDGKNYMPRIAARLDVAMVSEITAVVEKNVFERPIYAGNAIEVVESSDLKLVLTVRATAFPAREGGGNADIEAVSSAADPNLSRYESENLTQSERPELTSAKIVISGGRGMGSSENFGMLEKLADKLGAAVGASRAAVDAGFVPNDYQVGQTGKVVAPNLYVAIGISGAIQHLAGMKESKVIVAINRDEEAPIFQVSDYGLVADLFEAVPELEAALVEAGY